MTEVQVHSYWVTGTPVQVNSTVGKLRRKGELVSHSRPSWQPSGHQVVYVTVLATPAPAPARRLNVPSVVFVFIGALPFAGAGGWLTGYLGADFLGQVVAAVGGAGGAVFLLYALIGWARQALMPRHHCPGC